MNDLSIYIIGGVAWLVSFGIQAWLKNTYKKWGSIQNSRGLTGAETAKAILQGNNLDHVGVEAVKGKLTDHYDPRVDIVRLSDDNFENTSVAALAISAHETGHALQDAQKYRFMQLRSSLVPFVNLSAKIGPFAVLFGAMSDANIVLQFGVAMFAGSVLFHLVTLPVEFNASYRALKQIEKLDLISDDEKLGVKKLLTAAGMTYVAAAATSFAFFLYMFAFTRRR